VLLVLLEAAVLAVAPAVPRRSPSRAPLKTSESRSTGTPRGWLRSTTDEGVDMNDAGMPSHDAGADGGSATEVPSAAEEVRDEAGRTAGDGVADPGNNTEDGNPGDDAVGEVTADDADADDAADDDSDSDSDSDSGDDEDADESEDVDGVDADDSAGSVGGATGGSRRRSKARVALLEREGEVAADFLEKLLDIADLDGDIEVDIDGDRAAVAIVDSEEGRVPRRLVGPEGRVLDALQELTRLAVQTATGERSRLMLDVAGHRAARRAALVDLAKKAIAEVRSSGVAKALANMTAFERKVVHDEVTAAGLVSESEGVEPHRHIVISPA